MEQNKQIILNKFESFLLSYLYDNLTFKPINKYNNFGLIRLNNGLYIKTTNKNEQKYILNNLNNYFDKSDYNLRIENNLIVLIFNKKTILKY